MATVDAPVREAYAVYRDSVLTFYYDTHKPSSGKVYPMNPRHKKPGWVGGYNDHPSQFAYEDYVPNDSDSNDEEEEIVLTYDEGAFETPCESIKKVVFDESFKDYRPDNCRHWFDRCENLTEIVGIQYLNTSEVVDMFAMFGNCYSLKSLDLSNFDTRNVLDMTAMFHDCHDLRSLDLSSFNTSKVLGMTAMFANCRNLEYINLSSFNTSRVVSMAEMFRNCQSLKALDLRHFNTSNVRDMNQMFSFCESLQSLDVSTFNTSEVRDMSLMFKCCESLNSLNVRNFDTGKVTDMTVMFGYCQQLTELDVTNFNTLSVKSMDGMFVFCEKIKTFDLSSFNLKNVEITYEMFRCCYALTTILVDPEIWDASHLKGHLYMFNYNPNLVGEKGTKFRHRRNNKNYARIDGGFFHPGYLTRKPK